VLPIYCEIKLHQHKYNHNSVNFHFANFRHFFLQKIHIFDTFLQKVFPIFDIFLQKIFQIFDTFLQKIFQIFDTFLQKIQIFDTFSQKNIPNFRHFFSKFYRKLCNYEPDPKLKIRRIILKDILFEEKTKIGKVEKSDLF